MEMENLRPNLTLLLPDIADSSSNPMLVPIEKEIISIILKANKTPGKDGLRAELFICYPSSL